MRRLILALGLLLVAQAAHAANCVILPGNSSGAVKVCAQATTTATTTTKPSSAGSINNVLVDSNGLWSLAWSGAPTISGTNITSLPAANITGATPLANGGTASTTGLDAAAAWGIPVSVCTPAAGSIGQAVTGTTETVLGYCTIPAGMLSTDRTIEVHALLQLTQSSDTKTMHIQVTSTQPTVGSTTLTGMTACGNAIALAGTTILYEIWGRIVALGSTSSQACAQQDVNNTGTSAATITSLNDANPIYVAITGYLASTGSGENLTLRMLTLELMPATGNN